MNGFLKRIWGLALVGAVFGFVAAGFRSDTEKPEHGPTSLREFSMKDWKHALKAVKDAFSNKNLPILSAGVAYFSTLAFFPLMAAAVAIAAFAIEPEQLQTVVTAIDSYLPKDVAELISTQLENLTGRKADNLLAAAIAIGISLFGASGAVKNLVTAANIAYGVEETRGWLKQQVRGIGWTVGGIVFGFVVAVLLVINRTVLEGIGVFSPFVEPLLYGRWAIILLLVTLGLAFFYRFGPNRVNPRWQWISWGAIAATIVWLAGTSLFFVYVQNFANYSQSYSLFAGIIILMIWLNLSAFTVLLGASVNHSLEKVAEVK